MPNEPFKADPNQNHGWPWPDAPASCTACPPHTVSMGVDLAVKGRLSMVAVALPLKSRLSHLLPRNPLSHTHTEEVQSPASEQSAFVSHPCTAAPNR